MNKIAYIELDTHAEIAAQFYELTKDSKTLLVDFYFSQKIFKLLNIREKNIYITDYSNLLDILEKKNYDVIIVGTVHRHFIVYKALAEKYNTALIVHNLNFTKASKWDLIKNIFKKDFKYRLKLLLKEGLLEAPKVYQKANYLLGIDELMSKDNNLKFLPIYFNQFNSQNLLQEAIRIVIPGAVSQSRRDYNSLFIKLEKFEAIGINYEFVFLGKASGRALEQLKNVEQRLPDFISFKYFTEKIPQQEFDLEMKKADVLYCPIRQETEFFSVREIYGETKISGNIGDAIRYGKPAIFPSTYTSGLNFIIKEKPDLQHQISELRKQAFNFTDYSKETVAHQLQQLIDSCKNHRQGA